MTDCEICPFQRRMIEEFVGLTPGEAQAHGEFERLVIDTIAEFVALKLPKTIVTYSPMSSFFTLRDIVQGAAPVTPECEARWRGWQEAYPKLLARNPRLELRGLLQDISEARDACSWPYEEEWDIERWVAQGDPDADPYRGEISSETYEHLKRIHAAIGGWLFYDDLREMIVFAETEEFIKSGCDASLKPKNM